AVVVTPVTEVPLRSANQTLPSGPAVIPNGSLPTGKSNSVLTPVVGSTIAIAGALPPATPPGGVLRSVTQRLPSGPSAIENRELAAVRPAPYSVIDPLGVIRPITLPVTILSVN